jgi:serine protease Do
LFYNDFNGGIFMSDNDNTFGTGSNAEAENSTAAEDIFDTPAKTESQAEQESTVEDTGVFADSVTDEFQAAPPPQYGPPYRPFAEPYRPQGATPPPFYYGKPVQPYYTPPQYQQPAQYGQQPPPPPPPHKGGKKGLKVFYVLLSALLVFALVVSGFAIGRNLPTIMKDDTTTTTSGGPSLNISETPTTAQSAAPGGLLSSDKVAEKVKPSVIGVLVYPEQQSGGTQSNAAGEGSGVVMGMDESGEYTYIITCAHVINDEGMSISIQLEDGTQHKAELVGYDVRTDVGVIKVKMKTLKAAEFGNSGALKVGEWVFAVGNPGGTEFYGSFTSGVVSAIDRPVNSEIGYTMELIQHDAAINPATPAEHW